MWRKAYGLAVSPMSFELYAHARIFQCDVAPDFTLFEALIGRRLHLAKQWISDDGLITLLLTVDNEPPNWATADVLVNVRHDVFLLAYNAATRLCFIGSTRRTDRLYIEAEQSLEWRRNASRVSARSRPAFADVAANPRCCYWWKLVAQCLQAGASVEISTCWAAAVALSPNH